MTDNRTYRRLLAAIANGDIRRDPATYTYEDTTGRHADVDQRVYELELQGYVTLTVKGGITLTGRGEAWIAKPGKAGQSLKATFQAPKAAAR